MRTFKLILNAKILGSRIFAEIKKMQILNGLEVAKTIKEQLKQEVLTLKEQGKIKKVVVAGCLTQRYKTDLVDSLPEADLFVGSGEFQNI